MRVKFTIAVCALLMLGLVVTQVNAQGFNVSKSETTVVEHGRNQMMGAIRLDYVATGGNIDDGATIKVNYGSLRITSTGDLAVDPAVGGATLACGTNVNDPAGSCGANRGHGYCWQRCRHRRRNGHHHPGRLPPGTAGDFRHSERRPSGCFGSVCRGHDRGLHQFHGGREPVSFPSLRTGPKAWAARCPPSRPA